MARLVTCWNLDIGMTDAVLSLIYDGVMTKRFHTVATIKDETVGHHQGLVMALLLACYPLASRDLVIYAAFHDLAEHETGDVPSTVKRMFPSVKAMFDEAEASIYRQAGFSLPALTKDDHNRFKRCDNVAGMMTCKREYMLGNTPIVEQFTNFMSYYATLRRNKSVAMCAGSRVLDQWVENTAHTMGAPHMLIDHEFLDDWDPE